MSGQIRSVEIEEKKRLVGSKSFPQEPGREPWLRDKLSYTFSLYS